MNNEISQLKRAVELSPENIPLRLHFASVLMKEKLWNEAESEYLAILKLESNHTEAKSDLADLCFTMGKYSQAAVILEDLMASGNCGPEQMIALSRILLSEGDSEKAKDYYAKAIAKNRKLVDLKLETELGVNPAMDGDSDITEGRVANIDEAENKEFEMQKPAIDFSSVGGMESLKEEIRMKVIYPAKNPELFKSYGKKGGGGILLYGPPGCGKTYIAKATAGEVKSNFISVGLQDILEMWIGESEKNLHQVFELARNNKPSVLFFDEIDALAAKRTDMKQSAGRHVINQFLSELDGMSGENSDILVLGATNAPWHLDEAFKRPGRFDRIIFVPPPDQKARKEIIVLHLQDKPASGVDTETLAKKTDGFSGADLRLMVDMTIEGKLKEAMKSGKVIPITTKDLLETAGEIKPTTKEWFATAKNYAVYANESGIYDEIKKYLGMK